MTAGWWRRLEVRGWRTAAIRKNVWRYAQGQLLMPCSYSMPLDLRLGLLPGQRSRLGAWAWAQRGGGSLRRGGSDDGAGVRAVGPRAGVMAGRQGQAALEEQGRKRSACDWCPEVKTRSPGRATPSWSPPLVGLATLSARSQGEAAGPLVQGVEQAGGAVGKGLAVVLVVHPGGSP